MTAPLRIQRKRAAGWMPRCVCGRFISPGITRPIGWFAYGEHGSEEGWVCPRCLPSWLPRDGRGRGPEAGYCGVLVAPPPPPEQHGSR